MNQLLHPFYISHAFFHYIFRISNQHIKLVYTHTYYIYIRVHTHTLAQRIFKKYK